MKIPMEDLTANALNRNIIDKTTAQEMLKNPVWAFPIAEFTKANLKCIDDIADDILKMNKAKMEWEDTKKTVEDEAEWLEEIR